MIPVLPRLQLSSGSDTFERLLSVVTGRPGKEEKACCFPSASCLPEPLLIPQHPFYGSSGRGLLKVVVCSHHNGADSGKNVPSLLRVAHGDDESFSIAAVTVEGDTLAIAKGLDKGEVEEVFRGFADVNPNDYVVFWSDQDSTYESLSLDEEYLDTYRTTEESVDSEAMKYIGNAVLTDGFDDAMILMMSPRKEIRSPH